MKTDSIFYQIFQEFPSFFFELIGNSPEIASDYNFSSVEVKQTSFRIDGVFVPQPPENNPIYFVEVQFQADKNIYSRIFTEILIYLRHNQSYPSWKAIIIFPSRNIDSGSKKYYEDFFTCQTASCIYLDELDEAASLPISIATIKLVVEEENTAIAKAKELVNRSRLEVNSVNQLQQILHIVETILVYKFSNMSREEIAAMFEITDFKQTRFFQESKKEVRQEVIQEVREEVKLETVPSLLGLGLTVEQVAQALGLEIEQVRQVAQQQIADSDG